MTTTALITPSGQVAHGSARGRVSAGGVLPRRGAAVNCVRWVRGEAPRRSAGGESGRAGPSAARGTPRRAGPCSARGRRGGSGSTALMRSTSAASGRHRGGGHVPGAVLHRAGHGDVARPRTRQCRRAQGGRRAPSSGSAGLVGAQPLGARAARRVHHEARGHRVSSRLPPAVVSARSCRRRSRSRPARERPASGRHRRTCAARSGAHLRAHPVGGVRVGGQVQRAGARPVRVMRPGRVSARGSAAPSCRLPASSIPAVRAARPSASAAPRGYSVTVSGASSSAAGMVMSRAPALPRSRAPPSR